MPEEGSIENIINFKLEMANAAVNAFIDEKYTPHLAIETCKSYIRSLSFTADNYLKSKAKNDTGHMKQFDELMIKRETFDNIKIEGKKQDYADNKKLAAEIYREYDALLVITDIKK